MSDIDLATLPPPPDGTNPFAYFNSVFHESFDPPALPGAGARLYFLVGLLSYAVCTAISLLALLHITARRKGDRLWVYRMVERESTR